MKVKIANDLFNITNRLKDIDEHYYILFNTKTKKYEVHFSLLKQNSLCVICPYDSLDSRLYNYVLQTQVKNSQKIFRDIELNNEKIEKNNKQRFTDISTTKLTDIYNYQSNSSSSFDETKAFKTIWI